MISFLLSVWGIAIGTMLFGTLRSFQFLRDGTRPLDKNDIFPPVTILKPLKGTDPGIEENLESFFQLNYPEFEILFSVADPEDPVVPIVNRLIHKYSQVHARLFVGNTHFGLNPKINNLMHAYQSARYECILISDSNTRFTPDHLRLLARQFLPSIAMQTSLVAGVDAQGLGGQLEAIFLNTVYARTMIILATVGFPCVMGKAMLFRKSIMDKTRGLRSLTKHIAEDYAAGRKFQMLGHKVQLSQNPVRQHIGSYSIASFWSRHLRWGRIRKMQAPYTFLIEPLASSILSGVFGGIAFYFLFGFSPALFLSLHFGFWFICDAVLSNRIGDSLNWKFLPVWFFREVIHLPLWTHIAIGNTVEWRGQKIKLKRANILETRAEAKEAETRELRKIG